MAIDHPILREVLYVPTHLVTKQMRDAYTYTYQERVSEKKEIVSRCCGECKNWQSQKCMDAGYTHYGQVCKSFEAPAILRYETRIIETYKQLDQDTYIFSRGNLGKVRELFGNLGIEDQRVAPALGFDLNCTATLTSEQERVVNEWLKHGYGIIQAKPGWGKSVVWAWLVCHLQLKTLLLAQEVRHLRVNWDALYNHTNAKELEEQFGVPIIGYLNCINTGTPKNPKFKKRQGAIYPITLSTYQGLNSKQGKELLPVLQDTFGNVSNDECLTGDTLVPTEEYGLVRLVDLVEAPTIIRDMGVRVGTRNGYSYACRWIYNGIKPTLKISTKLGNSLTATTNHELLVLDPLTYDLNWVIAENLKIGDLLCISTEKYVRTSELFIGFMAQIGETTIPKKPVMTPELAFVLACITSENRTFSDEIKITNENLSLLDKYAKYVKEVFDYACKIENNSCSIRSELLVLFFKYLHKTADGISWAILEADEQSQLAFFAGFIEYSGYISDNIVFTNKNINILRDLQIMLLAHGYSSANFSSENKQITLERDDSVALYKDIKQYLSKSIDTFTANRDNKEIPKYRFVEIAKIEDGGEQKVYDITLEDTENRSFVANGIISSNCHHESAWTFHQVTRSFNAWYRCGLSATPTRKDQTHVGIYDTLGPITAVGRTEQMLPRVTFIHTGVKVPDWVFRCQYPTVKLHTWLSKSMEYQTVVFDWLMQDIRDGRKPFLFTERREHAKWMARQVEIAGYRPQVIMGGVQDADQEKVTTMLLDGRIHCVVGTKVLRENVNIPPLDVIHLPFPSFGAEQEEQLIGRIRRYLRDPDTKEVMENAKPQPLIRVYTYTANHKIPDAAIGFRKSLYKKWGFDFDEEVNVVKEKEELLGSNKMSKGASLKDWAKSFES